MITVNVYESNTPGTHLGLGAEDLVLCGDIDGRKIGGNTYDSNGKTWLHLVEFDEAGNHSNLAHCHVEVVKSLEGIKAAIEAHYEDVPELCFDFDTTAP